MDDYIVCTKIDNTTYRCSELIHCDYEDARDEANDWATEFFVPRFECWVQTFREGIPLANLDDL
jgi:hypothetical protein